MLWKRSGARSAELMKERLKELEEIIGVSFHDRSLLRQALSHSSYANEHRAQGALDNERLEFLGDAVLELVSSKYLYESCPDLPEGDLTKLRASIVCEPTLAFCARQFGLPSFLLLGNGEEHTGGRGRNSIVSDALEALIGAVFLDAGIEEADAFIRRFILNDIENKHLFYDSKTVLQEIVQGFGGRVAYEQTGEEEVYETRFHMAVFVDGVKRGEGKGPTKKAAQQQAAYEAVLYYKRGTN